jgi:hypothetical protein
VISSSPPDPDLSIQDPDVDCRADSRGRAPCGPGSCVRLVPCTVSLAVGVLGARPWRSRSLDHFVGSGGWPVFDQPAIPIPDVAPMVDEELAIGLFGRRLTDAEVSCHEGHRTLAHRLFKSGCDWALIFEDDAVVSEGQLNALCHWVSALHLESPTIIVLYSTTFVPMTSIPVSNSTGDVRTLSRLLVPPTHAVAYISNRHALRMQVDSPSLVVSSADWPPWSTGVTFYTDPAFSGVRHDLGESRISGRESIPPMSRGRRATKVLRLVFFSSVPRQLFGGRSKMILWLCTPSIRRWRGRPNPGA